MSKSNTFETDLLNLVFKNIAVTLIGDAAGLLPSAAAGSLYVALHTADPGEAGTQSTSEVTYGSYARVAVTRGAGWTVTGNSVSPAADINFPTSSSGSDVATWATIGASSAGAGKVLYRGAITAITCTSGTTPKILAASTIQED